MWLCICTLCNTYQTKRPRYGFESVFFRLLISCAASQAHILSCDSCLSFRNNIAILETFLWTISGPMSGQFRQQSQWQLLGRIQRQFRDKFSDNFSDSFDDNCSKFFLAQPIELKDCSVLLCLPTLKWFSHGLLKRSTPCVRAKLLASSLEWKGQQLELFTTQSCESVWLDTAFYSSTVSLSYGVDVKLICSLSKILSPISPPAVFFIY